MRKFSLALGLASRASHRLPLNSFLLSCEVGPEALTLCGVVVVKEMPQYGLWSRETQELKLQDSPSRAAQPVAGR